MQEPNKHIMSADEVIESITSKTAQIQKVDTKGLAKKLTPIWLYILFILFSLLFTIVSAVKIALIIWR